MIYSKVVIKNCRQTPILIFSPWQQPKIIRYVFSFVKRNISRYAKLSIRKLFYTQGLQAYIKRRHLLIHIHTCKTHWQCADDASIVSSDVVASPSYIGWKEAEWDILRKMSISNNSKIFFKACLVSGIRSSPPSSYIGNNIATVVVNIVLAVAGIILNSFVLLIFWKSAKLRSKLSHFSIMLLSSIDFGVVTVVHPLFVLKIITTMLGSSKCIYIVIYAIAILLFSGISAWTIFIINIERYFSIIHPTLHRNNFTRRRLMLIWVFFCFFAIFNVVSSIYFSFLAKTVIPITLSIIVLTSFYVYIAIFVVVRKKMSKVQNSSDQETSRNLMTFLRELKMAKIYVFVVSLCFLCYLPTVAVSGLIQNPLHLSAKTPNSVVNALDWSTTFASMNSTLNCLVFFWGNREMRKEGSKILTKVFSWQGRLTIGVKRGSDDMRKTNKARNICMHVKRWQNVSFFKFTLHINSVVCIKELRYLYIYLIIIKMQDRIRVLCKTCPRGRTLGCI